MDENSRPLGFIRLKEERLSLDGGLAPAGLDVRRIQDCIGDPTKDEDNPVLKAEQEAQVRKGRTHTVEKPGNPLSSSLVLLFWFSEGVGFLGVKVRGEYED